MYAFDAKGTTNCSGSPKTCQPVWTTLSVGSELSAPVVSGGMVFFADASGNVFAFDAAGINQCPGSPPECVWLWVSNPGDVSALSAGGGVVYAISPFGQLAAINATTGDMIWTEAAPYGGSYYPPVIANGVLYMNSQGLLAVNAATGQVLLAVPDSGVGPPSVVNGVIYQGDGNTLHAYHL